MSDPFDNDSLLLEFEAMLNEDSYIGQIDPFAYKIKDLIQKYKEMSEWAKMCFLKRKKLPSKFISFVIINERNDLILNALAENPSLSNSFVRKLLAQHIKNIDFTLASHQNCDYGCQNIIIDRADWVNIGQVALNKNTKIKTLNRIFLKYRANSLVLSSVASNPNLNILLIEKLAKTYNRKIILNLLKHPLVPTEILWSLERLFTEKYIRDRIQHHNNYTKYASILLNKFNNKQ
jgi:hypothetical protein